MTRETYRRVALEIERARAAADGIRRRDEDGRKLLAAFDSLVLAVEMLNDEVQRSTRSFAWPTPPSETEETA